MTQPPLLAGKHAVLFGAGGAVGTAVATDFAVQDATVFLSGRRLSAVEPAATSIRAAGGVAYTAEVDALDERAVCAYLDRVAHEAGSIDIVLNAMGPRPQLYGSNATSALELPLEQFTSPLSTLVPSQFITARAAARHMVRQHAGVILFISSVSARGAAANAAAIGSAFGAVESLLRCLAAELGPAGVRVVGIRSGPMVETPRMQQTFENTARTLGVSQEQIVSALKRATLLKRFPTLAATARLATFLASDGAGAMTGTIVNASSGMVTD